MPPTLLGQVNISVAGMDTPGCGRQDIHCRSLDGALRLWRGVDNIIFRLSEGTYQVTNAEVAASDVTIQGHGSVMLECGGSFCLQLSGDRIVARNISFRPLQRGDSAALRVAFSAEVFVADCVFLAFVLSAPAIGETRVQCVRSFIRDSGPGSDVSPYSSLHVIRVSKAVCTRVPRLRSNPLFAAAAAAAVAVPGEEGEEKQPARTVPREQHHSRGRRPAAHLQSLRVRAGALVAVLCSVPPSVALQRMPLLTPCRRRFLDHCVLKESMGAARTRTAGPPPPAVV